IRAVLLALAVESSAGPQRGSDLDPSHCFADVDPKGHHGQVNPELLAFTAQDAGAAATAARSAYRVRQCQDQASRRNAEGLQGRHGPTDGRLLADGSAALNVYWSVP